MSHSNKNKDPKYIGPGVWWSLHTLAATATTPELKQNFINFVKNIKDSFPCNECRQHFLEYNTKNPPLNRFNEYRGLFKWSFDCHNNANKLTGKPMFSYSEAEKMYYSPEICMNSCGSEETLNNKVINKGNIKGITIKLIK